MLRELHRARLAPGRGLSTLQLGAALEVEALELEPVLETLVALDWIGRVKESMRTLIPQFSMKRMLSEYMSQLYLPAIQSEVEQERIIEEE